MPRHVNRIPEMKSHRASGQAYVRLDGKYHYLGKFGSPESRVRYERTIAEWLGRGRRPVVAKDASGPSVSDVLAAFMTHAIDYYQSASGRPTGEADNFKEAAKPLFALYRDLPASDLSTDELKAVRMRMIESGIARSTINTRINRIRRIWKWAAKEKMVPVEIHAALMTFEPLLKNRKYNGRVVRESPDVEPVEPDRIKAILSRVPEQVAAMIELQSLTGCRVGEVISIRVGDVDRSCDPWEYRPGSHKNDWREGGQAKVIPLGPKAQAIVSKYLGRRSNPKDHLFNPRDSIAEAVEGRKVFHRIKAKPYYDRRAYTQAIYRGCDRAFPHPTISLITRSRTRKLTDAEREELKAWRKKNRWSPLQIRHATATLIRGRYGLEAAQAVLGHAKMNTTEIYAKKQAALARKIAKATG